jgi:hypothetical protein
MTGLQDGIQLIRFAWGIHLLFPLNLGQYYFGINCILDNNER